MATLNQKHHLLDAGAAYDADGAPLNDVPGWNGWGAARCVCGDQSNETEAGERAEWIDLHRAAVVWQIRNGERAPEGFELPPEPDDE